MVQLWLTGFAALSLASATSQLQCLEWWSSTPERDQGIGKLALLDAADPYN